MFQKSPLYRPLLIVAAVFALVMAGYYARTRKIEIKTPALGSLNLTAAKDVVKFSSEADFKDYIERSRSASANGYFGGMGLSADSSMKRSMALESAPASNLASPLPTMGVEQNAGKAADTGSGYSQTNVQVAGIDEPDIVKTDGNNIFMSSEQRYYYMEDPMPFVEFMPDSGTAKRIMPPRPESYGSIKTIKAKPAQDAKVMGKIPRTGEMLLAGKNLVVFEQNRLYGYDVSSTESPKEVWDMKFEDNGQLVAARLYDGKIYLITRNYIQYDRPCPLKPLTLRGTGIEIACGDIYHPQDPVAEPTTFNAFVINPASGEVQSKLAFVGSGYSSTVYMSEKSLYVTYPQPQDMISFMLGFLNEKAKDLLPAEVIAKVEKLRTYDISYNSKMTELGYIMEKYANSLDKDERRKLENELENRMSSYNKEHLRDLEKTGITKIELDGFKVASSGLVPGSPLNQYSLDEYKGNLRIATTIGGGWNSFAGRSESANDVYVLDKDLKISGQIQGLGLTEKIYSARFIGDRGYLVTFRQTDPFYVLDLSSPKEPKMAGELKIPGFSSYLHPLEDGLILGVGMEDGQVKLSLFNVQNASDPREVYKYTLKEYWSEVSNNAHAFLQDSKHKVFFIPAGTSGYVFSYQKDGLKLAKVISDIQAKRALYINDYLYVMGEQKMTVLDENTWNKVKELELK